MHCAQKRDLWPSFIKIRSLDKSICICRSCNTFEYRLFSIRLAMSSFRLSGRCLSKISLCWLMKGKKSGNRQIYSDCTFPHLSMFKVNKKFVAFPISDLEHRFHVQTAVDVNEKRWRLIEFIQSLWSPLWGSQLNWRESEKPFLPGFNRKICF